MAKLGIFKAHASKPTNSSNATSNVSVPSSATVPSNAAVPSSSFILETSEQGFHESSWNSKLNTADPFHYEGSGLENSDKTESIGDINVGSTSTSGGWTNPLDQIDAFSTINPVDSPDNFEDFLQSLK